MATATEISTFSHKSMPSSENEALALGTWRKAAATDLMMKSLTDSLNAPGPFSGLLALRAMRPASSLSMSQSTVR